MVLLLMFLMVKGVIQKKVINMKDLIISLFGSYEPVVYQNLDGVDVVASGMAGVDWVFLSGVVLFGITLYCVFRAIGGVFKK